MHDSDRLLWRRSLSRREFVAATAGLATALALQGCGGGGGGGGSNLAGQRTQPTGNLANQVNQFNTLVESLGLNATQPSQAMKDLVVFAHTQGRAEAPPELFFQATFQGLKALRGALETFAQAILKLDDMAAFGEQVALNMPSDAAASLDLKDPLWIGGMMLAQHSGLVYIGSAIEGFQTAGLSELLDLADSAANDQDLLFTYALIADLFNSLVDRQAAMVQMAVDPTWKLDDSESVTAAKARLELDRIEPILDRIPWGPGYASHARVTRSRAGAPGPIPEDEEASLIGEFIQKLVEATKDGKSKDEVVKIITDYAGNYSRRIEINPTGLMKSLTRSFGSDIVKEGLKQVALAWVKKTSGEAALCAAKLLLDVYDLVQSIISVIGTLEVPPLAVVMAGLASFKVIALLSDIDDCTHKQHKTPRLIGRIEKIDRRRAPVRPHIGRIGPIPTQNIPHNQRIPDKPEKKRRRCVSVRRKETVRGKIINYPRSQPSGPDVTPQHAKQYSFQHPDTRQVMGFDTAVEAHILPPGGSGGRADNLPWPRTHENMETASLFLLFGLGDRNTDDMQPVVGDGSLDITVADYAALFTVEPGTITFQVPPISDAAVGIFARDFVPQKVDPIDLTQTHDLPALADLTNASLGVIIHAK